MPASTEVTEAEYQNLAAIRYAIRRFLRFSEEAARAAGLTPQQHQAMLAIRACPSAPSVTYLAEQLQLEHNSAVGLVERLKRLNMVEVQTDPADRRRLQLHLTPAAVEVLATLSAAHRDELRRVGPKLRELLESLDGL